MFSPVFLARALVLLLFAVGVYFFHGFITPVLAALVISIATWPLYKRMQGWIGNRTLAATIALIIAILFMFVPMFYMAKYAIQEFAVILAWLGEARQNAVPVPAWVNTLPFGREWAIEQWGEYLGQPGAINQMLQSMGLANISKLYANFIVAGGSLFHIVLTTLFILITLFFLYRDGPSFAKQLDSAGEYFFPERWYRYSRIIPLAIRSTVLGMVVIAVGEGIVLGIAYWIAGVPSPVILGIITGAMAMIPGGAPLSFTLVSLYLIGTDSVMEGVLLFVWGATELFFVDKFLRPRLVGQPMRLPFLPTFFGLIGGVKTMGFLGLFIGPALMALLVTIWREFIHDVRVSRGEAEGILPPSDEL